MPPLPGLSGLDLPVANEADAQWLARSCGAGSRRAERPLATLSSCCRSPALAVLELFGREGSDRELTWARIPVLVLGVLLVPIRAHPFRHQGGCGMIPLAEEAEMRAKLRGGRRRWLVSVTVAVVLAYAGAAEAQVRHFGDARVLARVPTPPGFPEGIAVWGPLVWVAGPATFGTAGQGPSKVIVFHRYTGIRLLTFDTQGENLSTEHANSGLALDAFLRAYVLNTQLGIYRLSLNGRQEGYSAPFPDLPPCSQVAPGTLCSPTPFDTPPIPNDIVFDGVGNAYVTDSLQATIWRVPPGGGVPQIWFQDVRLATTFFGPNGIRLNPSRTRVYFTVSQDLEGRAFVYSLPLVDKPAAADLAVFHEYASDDLPDGIAFGESGNLYVAIAKPFASGVSILNPGGNEIVRLRNTTNPIFPYDSPANIAFDGSGSMLITNHAFVTGVTNPAQFTVLDVFVADRGSRLEMPFLL
jgi:sugar lactone lactonase YvrE